MSFVTPIPIISFLSFTYLFIYYHRSLLFHFPEKKPHLVEMLGLPSKRLMITDLADFVGNYPLVTLVQRCFY